MSLTAWVAVTAAAVSLLLAGSMTKRWTEKGGVHHLCWAVAFLLYAAASLGEWFALVWGWHSWVYKLYYFAAIDLVAVMAAGEIYLLRPGPWGRGFLVYVLAVSAVFAVHLVVVGPLDMTAYRHVGASIGGSAMPAVIRRWYPLLLSMVGGIVLIAGPLWSWWRTRVHANLLIALGALILSAAGAAASSGYPVLLPLSELLGILCIWFGVIGGGGRRQRAT